MKIDEKLFWSRARSVLKALKVGASSSSSKFYGMDSLVVWTDKNPPDEDTVDPDYSNASMMSLHLMDGFEFPETLFVFNQTSIIVVASEKKVKILEPCKGKDDNINLELIVRSKESKEWEAIGDKIAEAVKKSFSGKKASCFIHKEKEGFGAILLKSFEKLSVEVSTTGLEVMEEAFLGKDDIAIKHLREASNKACDASEWFRKYVPTLDDEPTKHEDMIKKLDAKLVDEKKDLESAGYTFVQSGSTTNAFNFNLKGWKSPLPSLIVSLDTIAMRAAVSCKSYPSLVARTLFIDPTEFQKDAYHLLLNVRDVLLQKLKPGVKVSDLHAAALAVVQQQTRIPASAFYSESLGYAIGLGFSTSFTLSDSNQRVIPSNSAYVIDLRLENLSTNPAKPDNEKYFSCIIADVVFVKDGAEVLTDAAKVNWSKNHFRFAEEEEDEKKEEETKAESTTKRRETRATLRSTEQQSREQKLKSKEEAMGQRQWDRMVRKQEEGLEKHKSESDQGGDIEAEAEKQKGKVVNAYSSPKEFPPSDWKRDRIHVDSKRECVLLPIGDRLVPFHLSTIKSVAKVDEGADSSSLRFNFHFPSGGSQKELTPEMIAAIETYPQLAYIKELSFKCRDLQVVTKLFTTIKDLQKRVRDKQKRESEEKDLVEQADLILLRERSKEKPATLTDVSMLPTPSIRGQGRCVGNLRAHVNGFRFHADKQGEVDILYSNVKYFFFQRGEKELKVLVHFYLKNPIMVGKKKTKHVQFFTEVQEGSSDLAGRGNNYDPDEIEDENRQRILVKKLDKIFATFCQQSLEIARQNGYSIGDDNEVEVCNTGESRKEGFYGMPGREMVLVQPTEHCLVNLSERDFFVICVDEIEHIHLERVSIGKSKNFDMVFVLKSQVALDHSGDHIKVVKIEAISMDDFEKIRDWIDRHDGLTYTCAATMLNWDEILKNVRYEMEQGFFWKDKDLEGEPKDIGWLVLSPTGVGDESEEEDEDDSSFSSEDSDDDDEEASDDEDSSMGSVVDEDDDDDDEVAEDSEEDDGKDWDELEKDAEEDDRSKKKRDAERDEKERKRQKKS